MGLLSPIEAAIGGILHPGRRGQADPAAAGAARAVTPEGAPDHHVPQRWAAFLLGGGRGLLHVMDQQHQEELARHDLAAQRAAFAGALTPAGFDPDAYLHGVVSTGAHLPSIEDLGRLETMKSGRQTHADAAAKEQRGLAVGAAAALRSMPQAQRAAMIAQSKAILRSQNVPEDIADAVLGDGSDAHLDSVIGMGIGANDWMTHQETGRHNLETEHNADEQLQISRGNLGVAQGNLGVRRQELELHRQRGAGDGDAPSGGAGLPAGYRILPRK
jgi:hypothetical protein